MALAKRLLLNVPFNCVLTLVLLLLGACGGTTTPQAPAAASGVTAEPGPGYVTVSWQDNSDNETGFEIYRTPGGAVTAQQSGEPLATVDANQTSYVDLEIELEQEYDYSVTAVNEVGAANSAAASSGASVPLGVDLMVGTINRLWSEDSTGTTMVFYYVLPEAVLGDQTDLFDIEVSGPPGWNDNDPLIYQCPWDACYRTLGYTPVNLNGTTALVGDYHLTVTAAGQTYSATARLDDATFKLARPTDIEITNVSTNGANISWTPPGGAKSHYVSVHHGDYQGAIRGFPSDATPSYSVSGLSLADGVYGIEVGVWNADMTTYPLKIDPYGWSYDYKMFGVGDIHSPECASADEVIAIPDAALQQAVRDELGIPSGDITCADMALLIVINASDAGIANLEGLQYAPNLADVYLHRNDVSDVSPLANLTKIWHLNLNLNEVTDVDPLANLTNLIELHLCCASGNIIDVTALEDMTQMEALNLETHGLGDALLWPLLANYPNLRRLWIGDNALSDLSSLASHTQLDTLSIHSHTLSDLTPLSSLVNLVELNLSWSEIADLSPVHAMTGLAELYLNDVSLTDISFLEGFTMLRELELADNQLTSLAPLVANAGLGEGDRVDVRNNPLDVNDPDVQADIEALRDRGVDLQLE